MTPAEMKTLRRTLDHIIGLCKLGHVHLAARAAHDLATWIEADPRPAQWQLLATAPAKSADPIPAELKGFASSPPRSTRFSEMIGGRVVDDNHTVVLKINTRSLYTHEVRNLMARVLDMLNGHDDPLGPA